MEKHHTHNAALDLPGIPLQTHSASRCQTMTSHTQTVNSLYDPLGFAAPVIIHGRLLLRELSVDSIEWDSPLPENKRMEWETWRHSFKDLGQLHIPWAYTTPSLSKAKRKELCIFSDASTKAIGAVAYLKTTHDDGACQLGFILLGWAKLAPRVDLTISRLELCAALLAVEMAELIVDEIDFEPDAIDFYCDSKVVLGYIYNETKRFYVQYMCITEFKG